MNRIPVVVLVTLAVNIYLWVRRSYGILSGAAGRSGKSTTVASPDLANTLELGSNTSCAPVSTVRSNG